jgi:ligand-binding sensor domain-containing protein
MKRVLFKRLDAAIVADQPGSLWIATENGLDHLDIKTEVFTHYRNNPKDSNSLSDNFITSLLKIVQEICGWAPGLEL